MNSPEALPPSAVVEHAQSLRALAFALLRDADAADDAVQDTWLRALERPPPRLETFGGWLRAVLLNVVSNQRRAERRRGEREHASARPEAIADTHERERALRSVVGVVLALEEPYKTIVLLRYFENLAPHEIATRLRLPPSIVYNRLHRAHAQLRARLEREDRGWVAALGLFAGVRPSGGALVPAGLSAGAVVVSLKILTAVAAAVILAGIFLWWRTASADDVPSVRVAAAELPGHFDGVDQAASPLPTVNDATRVEVPGESSIAEAAVQHAPAPFAYEVEFLLTDEDDAPHAGNVLIAPVLQPLDHAGTADFDGRFVARWRGLESSMEIVVAAHSHDDLTDLRRVRVFADRKQQVALRCRRAPASREHGARAGERAAAPLDLMLEERGGGASFVDPWMAREIEQASEPAVDLTHLAVDELRMRAVREFASMLSAIGGHQPFTLFGSITGADGEPAADVLVRARVSQREGLHVRGVELVRVQGSIADGCYMQRSDAAGRYAFSNLAPGDYEVVAGDGCAGAARTAIHGDADARERWDAKLERGRELRGRLIDARNGVLAQWLVELERDGLDDAHVDCAVTDERGEFRMPNLPAGAFRLLARPAAGAATLPVLVAPVVWPSIDVQEFVVLLELDHRAGSIRVDVRDELGQPLGESEVRVWKNEVACGTWARRAGGESIAQADGLLPGDYSVEIGAPGRAWLTIDHVFVPAGETIDLGRVALAAPGRIELVGAAREDTSKARMSFRRRGVVESHSREFRPSYFGAFELPAGEYQLTLAGDDPRVERLTVVAGQSVQVELAPR